MNTEQQKKALYCDHEPDPKTAELVKGSHILINCRYCGLTAEAVWKWRGLRVERPIEYPNCRDCDQPTEREHPPGTKLSYGTADRWYHCVNSECAQYQKPWSVGVNPKYKETVST